MRVVAALGGNALLERGEVPAAEIQQHHVEDAVRALAPLARDHELVVTHGNGPQVGLLAVESAADPVLPGPYPFDALGAQTQGMIGYWLVQALANELPGRRVVAIVTRTLVDGGDPAFEQPTKFVGQVLSEHDATDRAERLGWAVRPDGAGWRRVVASPEPRALLELATIRSLVADGAVVVCAGGGGIPVVAGHDGSLHGAEAVIDKDLASSLLARELAADALLLLTDVAEVQVCYGTPTAKPLHRVTAATLRAKRFAPGSMGPKVEAACRFAEATHHPAGIGRLDDAVAILAGCAGTVVTD